MRRIFFFFIISFLVLNDTAYAQYKTKNIVLVTLDGMRWQEVFGGVDSVLLRNKEFTRDSTGISNTFWSSDLKERRAKLFPFLWNTVAERGQLHGNRNLGSRVNVANPYRISYPGYNEILTGYADPLINSNDKVLDKNTNVLEFINQQNNYKNRVAVFSSWNDFPYIVNKWRNGIYVNSDVDTLKSNNSNLQLINDIQLIAPQPIDERPDVLTYFAAREYFKAYQPKVLYIAFDETDDWAHFGMYDQYLKAAHAEDAMLKDLWNIIQSNPKYKDKTTLLVTCDHGRGGFGKSTWRSHGLKVPESGEIWLAVIGPDTKALGECHSEQLYQKQFAATIAESLGFKFKPNHLVGEPIKQIFSDSNPENN